MTEHAMSDAASITADLFEIIRTTRSMRRLKPDPVPKPPALDISAARRTHARLQDLADQFVRHGVWFQPAHRPGGSDVRRAPGKR